MNKAELNRTFLNVVSLNSVGSHWGKASAESWEDYIASGGDILRISNAKANSLLSLLLDGGCAQSGTPTPSSPLSIISNKGAISYGVLGKNLLEVTDDNIVLGKYINNNGAVSESGPNMYFQRFVAVKPSTAYTLSTSKHINYANFMEYDANGVFIKRALYGSTSAYVGTSVTHTMGDTTAFVIIGSNIDSAAFPTVTKENVKSRNWMFNEGATALPYEAYRAGLTLNGNDEVWLMGKNLSYGKLIGKGYASTGGESTSSTFCGNLFKFPCSEGQKYTISWGNLPDGLSGLFVNSWNHDGTWKSRQAISATDKLTYTITSGVGFVNFTLYKTGGITIADDTWLQVEVGETATPYEPAIAPIKASAEMLLGVGSYADRQNLISGAVTRKVGIVVFTGEEKFSTSGTGRWSTTHIKTINGQTLMSSHYTFHASAGNNNSIGASSAGALLIRMNDIASTEDLKAFLAREYAKGTPVIVVYPLIAEKSETATPKSLANPSGEVTIIRDAEVIDLPMEATLKVKSEGAEITFTITNYKGEDRTFTAEEGMTWVEFCASKYNTEGWDCGEAGSWILLYEEGEGWFPTTYYLYDPSSYYMLLGEDLVKADHHYALYEDGGIGGV